MIPATRVFVVLILIGLTSPVVSQQADSVYLSKAKHALKRNDFTQARTYTEKVLATDSANVEGYIILGNAYILSIDSCFKYEFDQGMVYCLAVEMFEKGASMATDSIQGMRARNLVKLYSNYFFDPTDYHHIVWPREGSTYLIEGWIQKETIVRYRAHNNGM